MALRLVWPAARISRMIDRTLAANCGCPRLAGCTHPVHGVDCAPVALAAWAVATCFRGMACVDDGALLAFLSSAARTVSNSSTMKVGFHRAMLR
jgi:hypothetical protein